MVKQGLVLPSISQGNVCWGATETRSRRDDESMRAIGKEEQQRGGPVPPQPSGRMGVADDLFVVRRRRCVRHRLLLSSRPHLARPIRKRYPDLRKGALVLAIACTALSCGTGDQQPSQSTQPEVNVYSHRHYPADEELFGRFEELTGIHVNVVKAGADELINRLELEGENSPADLLVTVDAGRLHRAKTKGLLQPINNAGLQAAVPRNLRDPDNTWFGLTTRARVIVYSKERVEPERLGTYEDLTKPEWKGKVLVRSSANIYNQSLLASIVAAHGVPGATDWAKGLVANMARPPKGNDRDQVKAIVAGVGDVALVNTYYLGLLAASTDPSEQEAASSVGVHFPNQQDRGTHVNVSGAGVAAHAPNQGNAIRLLEFLTSAEAQQVYARANFEYPVRRDTEPAPLLASWGEFKADSLSLSKLGELNSRAVGLFEEAGWR